MAKVNARTLKPKPVDCSPMPKMTLSAVKVAHRKPYRTTVNGQESYRVRVEYAEAQGEVHGPLALVWTPYQHNPKSGYLDLIHIRSGYSLAMIGYGIRCARKVADELAGYPDVVWEFNGPDELSPDVLAALRNTVHSAIQKHAH